MRIVIVGGGIGGVAAGLVLHRAGAEPLVLEQAPQVLQVGAGVNISANGMKALKYLGVDEHIRRTSLESMGVEFNDLGTGECIGRLRLGAEGEIAWGESFYHVHRADLLDALLSGLPDDRLRLNSTVVGIEDRGVDVALQLADGTEIVGDAVVAADGLRSTVRTALWGEQEARGTGYVAWRSLIDAASAPGVSAAAQTSTWFGPRRHVVFYPVGRGQTLNFVGFVPDDEVAHRESWTASGDVEDLKASFAGSCTAVQAIVNAIDEAFITSILFREPLSDWVRGRVGLLGDSAHPVPPSAAQGACMALEDAVVLGRSFERFAPDGIERVFAEYQARRVPRTARLFGIAMNNFRMFNQSDPREIQGRNGRFRGLERLDPVSEATWGWLYGYDAVGAIDDPALPAGSAAATTANPLRRPEAREAFDQWGSALGPADFAQGEVGLRAGFERFMLSAFPPHTGATAVTCNGIDALQVMPTGQRDGPAILHLHGGLFTMGSARASVEYASRLGAAIGGWALVVDYRLAPEWGFPAALEDVLNAYRWMRAELGDAATVLLSGIDAGAGLAVSAGVAVRDEGTTPADGLFLISPLVDLTLASPSISRNAITDPWVNKPFLTVQAASYIHAHDPAQPAISPVYAELAGLPPMVIQAAAQEAMADDASRLAQAASAAGVDVQLTLVDDSVHGFTYFAELPETGRALHELAALASRARARSSVEMAEPAEMRQTRRGEEE